MGGVTIKEYGLSFVWVCLKNYIGRSWPVLAIFLAGIIISIIVSVLGKKKENPLEVVTVDGADRKMNYGDPDYEDETDDGATWVFIWVIIICGLTVFNPFLVRALIPKLGMTTVYYRFFWVLPITFGTFAILTMVFSGRIKERIPQPPLEKKVQINFWDGMFGVMRNKYKWIQTMVGLLDSLGNGMLAFTTILYLYTFRLSGLLYSLIVALVSFAGTPPDFFTPFFMKRFSYKQLTIFFQFSRALGNGLIVLSLLVFRRNVVLCGTICVVVLILMEVCKTVPVSVGHDMDIRINDYQMYLSGERLESFSGVFGWFTGPITSFVGLIIPLLLLNHGFNSNWDVLFIDDSRLYIIIIPLLIDTVGYLLMAIPYFFWDYDDDKQNKVMAVLRRREEVTAAAQAAEGTEATVNE